MKLLLQIVFVYLPFTLAAQHTSGGVHAVSNRTAMDVLTPDSLARQLTQDYKTDREKITSIFKWITENISYNIRPYYNATHNPSSSYSLNEADDTAALKPLSERVAIDVLNRKIAFCDGYARLFKTLCDYAGIKSEIITGYAATNIGSRKFNSNHRWNAVFLDSAWQLLDATWAAGHLTYSANDYVQSYNNYYFLTPAKDFARDHYPEDLRWTLLADPPFLTEFRRSPFRTHGFLKYSISSFKPETGVIEAAEGDTLHFEVQTNGDKKNLMVLDTAFIDSATVAIAASDTTKNTGVIAGSKAFYNFIVKSTADRWLTVVMNDEVILRYRLNVRKNDTALAK